MGHIFDGKLEFENMELVCAIVLVLSLSWMVVMGFNTSTPSIAALTLAICSGAIICDKELERWLKAEHIRSTEIFEEMLVLAQRRCEVRSDLDSDSSRARPEYLEESDLFEELMDHR